MHWLVLIFVAFVCFGTFILSAGITLKHFRRKNGTPRRR